MTFDTEWQKEMLKTIEQYDIYITYEFNWLI